MSERTVGLSAANGGCSISLERVTWKEGLLVGAIVLVIAALLWPVYRGYQHADDASWETVTLRVMRSIEPPQQRTLEEFARYSSGVHDPTAGVSSLMDTLGWRPSEWDRTRYEVRAHEGYFEVTASRDGETLCRRYPGEKPCA